MPAEGYVIRYRPANPKEPMPAALSKLPWPRAGTDLGTGRTRSGLSWPVVRFRSSDARLLWAASTDVHAAAAVFLEPRSMISLYGSTSSWSSDGQLLSTAIVRSATSSPCRCFAVVPCRLTSRPLRVVTSSLRHRWPEHNVCRGDGRVADVFGALCVGLRVFNRSSSSSSSSVCLSSRHR